MVLSMVMIVKRPLVVLLLVLKSDHDSTMATSYFVRVAKSGHDSSMTTRCFKTLNKQGFIAEPLM